MLLNNLKKILLCSNSGTNYTLTDVLGESHNIDCYTRYNNDYRANSHYPGGAFSRFDYAITTATNSFVAEQTTYSWLSVVRTSANLNYRDNGLVLFLGTGTTSVIPEDFKLASPISLTVNMASCRYVGDTITVSRTFTNNTENNVDITEVGLYMFTTGNNSTGTINETSLVNRPIIMIGRKVLSEAVTLNVGENKTFNYVINFSNLLGGV